MFLNAAIHCDLAWCPSSQRQALVVATRAASYAVVEGRNAFPRMIKMALGGCSCVLALAHEHRERTTREDRPATIAMAWAEVQEYVCVPMIGVYIETGRLWQEGL